MEQRKRNKLLALFSWGIGGVTGALLLWGAFVEPYRLTVRREMVVFPGLPPALEGCRALLVADTHFGNTFIDRFRRDRIVRRAQQEKADLCFLLGDYIAVGSLPGYGAMAEKELKRFFSALKAPLGTFAVLGNHELWYGRKRMASILESSGVQLIENRAVSIKGSFTVAGISDFATTPFNRNQLDVFLKENAPQLLLTHKGGVLKYLSADWKGTIFAADTHGGQIRIPGVSSLGDFLRGRKELAPGVSFRWGRRLFITTGAGGHRSGFRLFCPPEIAVVTFTKGNQIKI